MLQHLIRGGVVVDGTGGPERRCDIGVVGDTVQLLPEGHGESAVGVIDADGLTVAPGFIDIHTHLDAQVLWDPTCSPSLQHGTTTVVSGNCGYSLAPLSERSVEYLLRMMSTVEGMPAETLSAALAWNWRSFGEYLGRVENQPLGPNIGFLVGHSALRLEVMGPERVHSKATEAEVNEMARLLSLAISEGALGLSSSASPGHFDGTGGNVPSFYAGSNEFLRLAAELRDTAATVLEFIPTVGRIGSEQTELMSAMSRAAGLPLNWNLLNVDAANPDVHECQLDATQNATRDGGSVVALMNPIALRVRLNFVTGFSLSAIPGWESLFNLSLEDRKAALRDSNERLRLATAAVQPGADPMRRFDWSAMTVAETFTPDNAGLAGRRIGDIARERGKSAFDTLVDISLADGLRTGFSPPAKGDDQASWELRAELGKRPDVVLGGSDAGAHLDMFCGAMYTTQFIDEAVRRRGILTLSEAVRLLSDVPAQLYKIKDRGRIANGWKADLVIFDPDAISPGPVVTRRDLPGGQERLVADAVGIRHVLVNGEVVVADGIATGRKGGAVIRAGSGTDGRSSAG